MTSDTETSGWPDEGENTNWAHIGGDGTTTPGPTLPGTTSPHPENTSHLLSALNSESPLQGKCLIVKFLFLPFFLFFPLNPPCCNIAWCISSHLDDLGSPHYWLNSTIWIIH